MDSDIITDVEVISLAAPEWSPPRGWHAGPLDGLYPQGRIRGTALIGHYSGEPGSRTDRTSIVIVRVTSASGEVGISGIGLGSRAVVEAIRGFLAPMLKGQSAFDTTLLWERMYRSTLNIGMGGLMIHAISALDIALWDLKGKLLNRPVYQLIGGKTRDRVPVYCSGGYTTEDPAEMASFAKNLIDRFGFMGYKFWFGYGPRDGISGMRRNYECVEALRDALGPDVAIMGDAYMAWDVPYSIAMMRMLEPLDLYWLEEPLLPENIEGLAEIRDSVGVAVTAGEHIVTKWSMLRLLKSQAVDILQPDVNRVGGITEALKIWSLAEAFGVEVIPHSHNFHNFHLVASHTNSPMSEYFPPGSRDGDTFFSEVFDDEPVVTNGTIGLPQAPGLGVTLNEELVAEFRMH